MICQRCGLPRSIQDFKLRKGNGKSGTCQICRAKIRKKSRLKTMKLPPVDCEYGYYEETLEKLFGPGLWEDFCKWHYGQTCALIDNKRVIYPHDVRQFLAGGDDLEFGRFRL